MPRPFTEIARDDPSACLDGMAGYLSAPQRLEIPGRPEQVPVARLFVRQVLGDDHPCTERVMLLTSELVTNSVKHSRSQRTGGTVTVIVTPGTDRVQVQVHDEGGETVPTIRPDYASSLEDAGSDWLDDLAECGRGLRLVDAYALTWDYYRSEAGTVTWFECAPDPLPDREGRGAAGRLAR